MSGRLSLGGRLAVAPPRASAPVMTFPILATEEIIVSLSELGINITEDDLVKARPEVLKNVFDQLIILVLNVTKDELYQAKFSGLAAVDENSELHEESVHIVHWMRSMNKLLQTAGMHEGYSLKDLMRPDRLRVQKALSGIINLQKFKESVQEDYDRHVRTTASLVEGRTAVENDVEALRLEIANLKHVRESEKPEIISMEHEVSVLTAQKSQLDREEATVRAAGIEQKTATNAMLEEITNLNNGIAGIKEEIALKRSQFVGSPKRIKEGLETVARAVEAARAEAAHQEDNRRALLRRTEVVLKGEKDVAKAISLLAELEAEITRHKASSKTLRTRQVELDAANADLSETASQVKHVEELLRVKEAKLTEIKAEYGARTGSTDKGIVALRTELAGMQTALAAARTARAEAEARKAQVEDAKERAVALHNSEMVEMTSLASKLQSSIAEYHACLFKKMAEVQAAGPVHGGAGSSAAVSSAAAASRTAAMFLTPSAM